jgi:hypothetical protein
MCVQEHVTYIETEAVKSERAVLIPSQ